MREIKFRGKDIDNRLGLHYGYFFKDGDKTYISEKGRSYEVSPKTVGEFTGLYDQDKKEIYEGDIVDTDADLELETVLYKEYGYLPFMDQVINCSDAFYCWNFAWYLVVGNIYENPELLKKGGAKRIGMNFGFCFVCLFYVLH